MEPGSQDTNATIAPFNTLPISLGTTSSDPGPERMTLSSARRGERAYGVIARRGEDEFQSKRLSTSVKGEGCDEEWKYDMSDSARQSAAVYRDDSESRVRLSTLILVGAEVSKRSVALSCRSQEVGLVGRK